MLRHTASVIVIAGQNPGTNHPRMLSALEIAKQNGAKIISINPLREPVAAVSCGIYQGKPVLDLDYAEDSAAETDTNFVITGSGGIVEVQGTAEGKPFSEEEFLNLLRLAKAGVSQLVDLQKKAVA